MMLEGIYSGIVVGGTTCESSQKKTPQIAIHIQPEHQADQSNNWQPIQPQQRTIYLALTDAAWGYTEAKLKSINFNGNFDAPEFTHDAIMFECKHESYNGKPQERWDLLGNGNGTPDKAPADIVRRLNTRWKTGNATKTSTAPKTKAPPPPVKKESTSSTEAASEEAWQEFCKHCPPPKWDKEHIEKEWNRILAEFFGDMPLTQLTVADWHKMRDEGPAKIIPF